MILMLLYYDYCFIILLSAIFDSLYFVFRSKVHHVCTVISVTSYTHKFLHDYSMCMCMCMCICNSMCIVLARENVTIHTARIVLSK